MSEVENNKAVARRLIESTGDVAAQLALFHEEGRIVTMGSTMYSGVSTKEALRGMVGMIGNIFPDGLEMTIHNIIGEGDCVAVEAESHGRHVSGRQYNNKYHFLLRFKDGLVLEMKEYFDTEHTTDVLCGGKRPPSAPPGAG
jgi:ketosteroid isomerase-like protein